MLNSIPIKWPDPDSFDYSALEDAAGLLPAGAKLIVSIGYIYATVTRLMGFQNFCEKLIDDPDLVARVFERVGQIQLRVFENVVTMDAVGATWQPDDVAYVSGTMIAPKHLRQHVWPWYREMCRVSRQLGKPIIYHSDGKLDPIMDDILDVGFTSLHPIEPEADEYRGDQSALRRQDFADRQHRPWLHVDQERQKR